MKSATPTLGPMLLIGVPAIDEKHDKNAPNRADVLRLIKDWIIEHIVEHDLKIRDYLPTRNVTVD